MAAGRRSSSASSRAAPGPCCRNCARRDASLLAAACQLRNSGEGLSTTWARRAVRRPSRHSASPRRSALAAAAVDSSVASAAPSSGTLLHELLGIPHRGHCRESTAMASKPNMRRRRTRAWPGSKMDGSVMPCCCVARSMRHVECITQPHSENTTLHSSWSCLSHSGQPHTAHSDGGFDPLPSTPRPEEPGPPSSLVVVSTRTSLFTESRRQHTSLYFAYLYTSKTLTTATGPCSWARVRRPTGMAGNEKLRLRVGASPSGGPIP
mmetsp:Transcript_122746/g.342026  ORF Transcript_122746/g.342026 Transcript_122746/m.342026 type:complete len:265 (+) Transcript_122746:414-1208(+)